ncbi:glycosyltransferase [Curvibacter sp. CHRR-16]|uniref:glycosyltransferase n=1 Tax=Curvibacter sp. CHRR-16 TaxID=2835872 RepID=UPI001BDA9586|nr:glycosyltransferase [Curvibacter sp. CHRR-16]MBT0571522.1 glycosyltransferase [Curvibacter sp. CHRR-16]
MTRIAYLSPAMPALSETFVYEELLALERTGVAVEPFSVRQPAKPVPAQQALAQRVTHLYAGGPLQVVLSGLTDMPWLLAGWRKAAAWLLADMLQCRPWRLKTWKLAYQFVAAATLAKHLRQRGCTHLHVHFAHVPTQIAMYASAMAGVPFTVMAHANDIFEEGLLLPQKAARAKRMLTISDYNRRYLLSLGIPEQQLAVVRCGVSFAARPPVEHDADGPYKLASLGRMVEKKGFDVLINAVALLRQQGMDVSLSLAGDGPLLADMQALVQRLQLQEHVQFVGSLPHHAVADWMREHHAFVLACKQDSHGDMDGIPVVLMEAMSQGVPVVSTRLSGIPELVVHEQTGLLAEPNDAASLATQIARLISGAAMGHGLVAHAQEHVKQEFGQASNINRLIQQISA